MLQRKSAVAGFYREISAIEKKIKKLGTTDSLLYIAEQIETIYGMPCRIRKCGSHHKRIVLYKQSATKKQIQYDRPEVTVGSLLIFEEKTGDIYIDYYTHTVLLPSTISGIFDLLTIDRNEKYD